jgi:hypothetical protein
MFIISIVIAIPITMMSTFLGASLGVSSLGFIGFAFIGAITYAISYGLTSVFTALLYARLRELKEGIGIDDLTDVFS